MNIASIGKADGKAKFNTRVAEALKKALNITYTLQIGSHSQIRNQMKMKKFDIFFESQSIPTHDGNREIFSVTYPVMFYSVFIVTHTRGLLTPLEKIYNYYGYLIVTSTIIILAMTFVVIYLSKRDVAFVIFEIIRLLINAEIFTPMKTSSSRIFFSMIFLYFLIIHGTFSGRLAEFLTRIEYRKNVETLEDLKDPRYTKIYAYNRAREFINDPELIAKTNFRGYVCGLQIRKDPSVACINDLSELLPAINNYNLHRSKRALVTGYYSQLVRKNLLLGSKINEVMIWLAHSGLSEKWTDEMVIDDMRGIRAKEERSQVHYRPINFGDLKFSLVLLALGLICSTICFILELVLEKIIARKKRNKARVRWMVPKFIVRLGFKNRFNGFNLEVRKNFNFQRVRNVVRRFLTNSFHYWLSHL